MSKIRKNNYRTEYKLLLLYAVISDAYKSFIANKTIFTQYCLTLWISKLPGSFEIHWARQYLVNFMALAGIINTTVYKTKPIITGLEHGKLFQLLTLITVSWEILPTVTNRTDWSTKMYLLWYLNTSQAIYPLGIKLSDHHKHIRNYNCQRLPNNVVRAVTAGRLALCWLAAMDTGACTWTWLTKTHLRLRQNDRLRWFFRRHFQMHFLEWKCINFDWDFTEICSQGSN